MNAITNYLAGIGAKGGASKSDAKLKAVNRNLKAAWVARKRNAAARREAESKKPKGG